MDYITLLSLLWSMTDHVGEFFTWDFNKIQTIRQENKYTFYYIVLYYIIIHLAKIISEHFSHTFVLQNKNLLQTKSNYFLSVHVMNCIHSFHDASIAILLGVGHIQYMKLNKYTNLYCYAGQLLLKISIALVQWYKDYPTHMENEERVTIWRNGIRYTIRKRQLIQHDIIHLIKGDMVPVTKAIITDPAMIHEMLSIHVPNVMGINDLSQTGEDKVIECGPNEFVYFHHNVESDGNYYITVLQTEGTRLIEPPRNESHTLHVPTILKKSTYVGVLTILLTTIFISYLQNTWKPITIVDVITNGIGIFIANNFLIPSFKLTLAIELWNLCYFMYCASFGITINDHGTDTYNMFSSKEKNVICTDKTGTIVESTFDLCLNDCIIPCVSKKNNHVKNKIQRATMISQLGGFHRNDKQGHVSDCVENTAILDALQTHFDIRVGTSYLYKRKLQEINYTYQQIEERCIRHAVLDFNRNNNASFSITEYNKHFYIGFEMGTSAAETILHYKPRGNSTKRSMIIGHIPLRVTTSAEAYAELERILPVFQKKEQIHFTYEICGEFYFNYYFCKDETYSSDVALRELSQQGYPIFIISGDNPKTVAAIAENAGLHGDTIDVNAFRNYDNHKKIDVVRNALQKKGGFFGHAKPHDKEEIIKWCQYLHWTVLFCGDQDNDKFAITSSNFSVVHRKGDKKLHPLANMIGNVPLAALQKYISTIRLLGTMGKFWFCKAYLEYCYITTAIWLLGAYLIQFEKISILFMDPWDANLSTVTSAFMLITCITMSFLKTHRSLSEQNIVYISPMIAYGIAVTVGYLLIYFVPLSYSSLSLPAIFIISLGKMCFI